MKIKEISTLEDEKKWQDYVFSNSNATSYHTLEWRDILCREYKFKPIYLMAQRNKEVVGILPLFFIKNLTGKKLISLPFSMYGGFLGRNDFVLEKFLKSFKELSRQLGVKRARIRSKINISSSSTQRLGLVKEMVELDSILRLREPKEMWKGFRKTLKWSIKKAERNGLNILVSGEDKNNKEVVKEFYKLLLRARKRFGLPTPSKKYIESLLTIRGTRIILVVKNNLTLAGGMFFYFKDKIFHPFGASNPKYLRECPVDFLFWNVLKEGYQRGYKEFYFGGTPKSFKGLLAFKEKWASLQEPIYEYRYSENETQDRDVVAKERGIFLFKVLPLFISRYMGKYTLKYFY